MGERVGCRAARAGGASRPRAILVRFHPCARRGVRPRPRPREREPQQASLLPRARPEAERPLASDLRGLRFGQHAWARRGPRS